MEARRLKTLHALIVVFICQTLKKSKSTIKPNTGKKTLKRKTNCNFNYTQLKPDAFTNNTSRQQINTQH